MRLGLSPTWPACTEQGKYADAEGLHKRALAIKEKTLGQDHPDVAKPSTVWPTCTEARQVRRRRGALQARAGDLGEGARRRPPRCGRTLNDLAVLSASSGNSKNALAYSRKATASVIAHAAAETTGAQHKEGTGGLVEQRTNYFVRHVANLAAAAQKRIEPEAELGREAFVMAQWAKQSAAAAAVQQMGLRFAAGSDALAALVRERQDLSAFWRERDKALDRRRCRSRKASSNPASIDAMRKQIAADREQARRQRGAARTGVSRICGAGEPEAAQGRGSAAIARRR